MTNSNADQSLMDKSMRSVFVGNIPYEATEENLKDIFSEVGPVLSFKLVYDRETGKPKGYGFCEYKDQETALSAMRNLNSYEIGGRTLRVDNACTEKSRMEMQSLLQTHNTENAYGEAVQSDKAPEAISKAVAALPPEQMFELMKQMKLCVQNNPNEARQMLLQNPQLSYALLQAHVVMRVVDPQTAVSMLHKANSIPAVITPNEHPPIPTFQPRIEEPWATARTAPVANLPPSIFAGKDVDLRTLDRTIDHRLARMDMDLRTGSQIPPIPVASQMMDTRPPVFNAPDSSTSSSSSGTFCRDPRGDRFGRDPRDPRDPRMTMDPRMSKPPAPILVPPPQVPHPVVTPPVVPTVSNVNSTTSTTSPIGFSASSAAASRLMAGMSPAGSLPSGASDQEKAALIMQVLQLTDDQIAKLPMEQRQSILVLKEQIANSTPR